MTNIQFELIDDGSPSVYEGPTLYKLDSVGRLRTWRMQLDDRGHYRTLSGRADGKQAESSWTVPVPASQPTVKDQGEFEVRAQYRHQLDREYHASADTVSQPKMIEPMLAKTYAGWPGIGFFQPKLDGIRCIMTATGLFSRQGQPIAAVPHLHAALAPVFAEYPDLVLDGELYNHDLREDFGEISSIVRKKSPTADDLAKAERVMQYHVYDTVDTNSLFGDRSRFLLKALAEMLQYHVYDTVDTNSLFGDRSRFLLKALAPHQGWIVIVPTRLCLNAEQADEAYEEAIRLGYEGGIYRLDKPYELGRRSKFLLKRKEFITREYPLVRFEEGTGNWAGTAKRAVLTNDDGTEFGAGLRGSFEANKRLLECTGGEVTLRFFQLTPDGVPRFPVVIDYHPRGRQD
jgi:DNA ligase-1